MGTPSDQHAAGSAAPAPVRTYEIQRLVGDRWVLDSVADAKNIAIKIAKGLLESGRAPLGVQVTSVYLTADGQFREVRIYAATPEFHKEAVAAAHEAEIEAKRKAAQKAAADPGQPARHAHRQPAAPAKKKGDPLGAALWRQLAFRRANRLTWVAIGLAVVWSSIFLLWRQPQSPWAFDTPAAQQPMKQRPTLP